MFSKLIRFSLYGSLATSTTVIALDSFDNEFINSFGPVRFGRAAVTAASIAVDYKWNLYNLDSNTNEYEQVLSKVHLRSANRLKDLFCKNRGAFIKVGQHIGGLDYLLPSEYVQTMKTLHDKAPESDVTELFETIENDLKCKISDIFKEIDQKPIGTASLAQCHRAVLKDGTVVAVKIQHPSVKKNSYTDIKTMTFLVNCLAKIFPDFKFVWLAEETEKNLPIELDFINEGRNIEKVAKILSKYKFVKVPKVYWNYCSDRVLTMEFCQGFRVDNVENIKKNRINVNKISERLGMIFSEMIFSHGFVHCDPHPGNVLINPITTNSNNKKNQEFQIVLIDHGLYQNLSLDFRYNYANVWMTILKKDIEKLELLTRNFIGHDESVYFGLFACIVTGRSWEAINKGIDKTDFSNKEGFEIQSEASKYLREISIVLNRIPREMLLLLKTNDLLRGIESSLHTRNSSSSFIHMSKCCVKLINSYERNRIKEEYSRIDNEIKNKNLLLMTKNKIQSFKLKLNSYFRENFDLFKIFSYEFFLYMFNL